MNRSATGIVAVLVLGITASALVSKEGIRDHRVLTLAIPAFTRDGQDSVARFAPLRFLLARQTGRRVRLVPVERWEDGAEVWMMPVEAIEAGGVGKRVAVCGFYRSDTGRDQVVVFYAAGRRPDLSILRPADAVVGGPVALGGFEAFISILESKGFRPTADVSGICARPGRGQACRAVFDVLHGRARVGACLKSEIDDLVRSGAIARDEIDILGVAPAPPDYVIACRSDDAPYYERVLGGLAGRLAAPESGSRDADAVEVLRFRRLAGLRLLASDERRHFDALLASRPRSSDAPSP